MIQEIPNPTLSGATYIERFYNNSGAYRYNTYYGYSTSSFSNTRASWTASLRIYVLRYSK